MCTTLSRDDCQAKGDYLLFGTLKGFWGISAYGGSFIYDYYGKIKLEQFIINGDEAENSELNERDLREHYNSIIFLCILY